MFSTGTMKALAACAALLMSFTRTLVANAQSDKPNILIICADDVGMWNISAYHHGMMGAMYEAVSR